MNEISIKEKNNLVILELSKVEKATIIYALESYKTYILYREKTENGLKGLMKSIYVDLKSTIRLFKKGSDLPGTINDLHNIISSLFHLQNFYMGAKIANPDKDIKYKIKIVIARIEGIWDKLRSLIESNNDFKNLSYLLP